MRSLKGVDFIHSMRICIVHNEFPETDTNSGALRMYEIVRLLLQNGHQVTYFSHTDNGEKYRTALECIGAECITDSGGSISGSPQEMYAFQDAHEFDIAVFVQYNFYILYAPIFRALFPNCRLILDTLDLHFLRLSREAELLCDNSVSELAESAKRDELQALHDADSIWVVTQVEKDILSGMQLPGRIHVVENIHRVDKDPPGLENREGIVFLGGYRHSPNVDAVKYFLNDIYPLLQEKLPDIRVTIAGSHPPYEFNSYEQKYPNVRVTGFVEDHRALLRAHRVGIAPLRYGAGMKGKIGEYLSCGLPCVTTFIGAEGMRFTHEKEVLIADRPQEFVDCIVRLYTDNSLWKSLSAAGIEYISTNLSSKAITPHVLDAIEDAASPRERTASSESIVLACKSLLRLMTIQHPLQAQRYLIGMKMLRTMASTLLHGIMYIVTERRRNAGIYREALREFMLTLRTAGLIIRKSI